MDKATSQSFLIKPDLRKHYPLIDRGEGVYLWDKTGRRYIDASSGAVTANIGHNVPEIRDAMIRQSEEISFVYRSQFTSEAAEALAARISQLAPGKDSTVFLVNSGTEAVETAMKIALQYWEERGEASKREFLARRCSYHGITLGALSASGHIARRKPFSDLLFDWSLLEPPYCYRCPWNLTFPSCELSCAQGLEELLCEKKGAVAAFVAEPVSGAAGGAIVPPAGYFERVTRICKEHDLLLLADEVMTGFGRCGSYFASEDWQVPPDLIAVGKGLGGGYTPIGAVVVSREITEVIRAGSGVVMSGHTMSANPQSAAVALAVLDYIDGHDLVNRAALLGASVKQRLLQLADRHDLIGDVRGAGLLWGIEFVRDRKSKGVFLPEVDFAALVIEEAMKLGLLLYPASGAYHDFAGRSPSALLLAPPLVITIEQLDELFNLFDRAIAAASKRLSGA